MVAVSVAPCPPPTLSGVDLTSEAGLGCGLCLASDPHGLAGLEVAALRVDCHAVWGVLSGVSLQARGAAETPLVCGSEIDHHGVHLIGIDGARIPAHPITGLHEMATDLPIGHAANELLPGGLIVAAVLDTRLSGVVEELIVANPEGSIPGLVGCPSVVGAEGAGHDLGSFGMCKVYRVARSVAVADVPVGGLDLRGREGEGATLSERLAIGGGSCHHVVVLLSVGCHDGGEVRCFVHVLSIGGLGCCGGIGGQCLRWHIGLDQPPPYTYCTTPAGTFTPSMTVNSAYLSNSSA